MGAAYVDAFYAYLRRPHLVPGSWGKGSALALSIMNTPTKAAADIAISTLSARAPHTQSLAEAFAKAGFRLALVGGPVRDAILGKLSTDLDFTTNARPEDTKKILNIWADSIWDTGIQFGTVAGKKDDITVEVTTYRSEKYDVNSRKPEVNFGDDIAGDLARRDFTVNAMALELTTKEPVFIDPFNGAMDLAKKFYELLEKLKSYLPMIHYA